MELKKFGHASAENIKKLEEKYKVTLPEDYRNFLAETNGGVALLDHFCPFYATDLEDELGVQSFYGVDINENLNIETYMDMLHLDIEEGDLQEPLIIGDTLSNGLIVLSCAGDTRGVFFWDDNFVYENSSEEEGCLYWIAETFTEFVKMLQGIKIVGSYDK